MNREALHRILQETTVQLRKGAEVEIDGQPATPDQIAALEEGEVPGHVVEFWNMAHVDEADADVLELVDVHFMVIGVHREKAESCREELQKVMMGYPDLPRLAEGPSYIEVGAHIGDQGLAFQLFALGKVLGWWEIVTPEFLGFQGEEARSFAGRGLVLMTPHRESPFAKGEQATS